MPDVEFASYSGYMSAIFLVVGIFVATTAPEMLCVDRRERTLPLYFSRAITRHGLRVRQGRRDDPARR